MRSTFNILYPQQLLTLLILQQRSELQYLDIFSSYENSTPTRSQNSRAEKMYRIFNFSVLSSFLVVQLVKNLPAIWETWVQSLCWEDPLEKGMTTHSSILAWIIPWTVQSMGSQSQTRLSDFYNFLLPYMGGLFRPGHLVYFLCSSIFCQTILPLIYSPNIPINLFRLLLCLM